MLLSANIHGDETHQYYLGRLGGDEPARLTDAKPGTKDRQGLKWRVWRLPTVTAFPLKVREQGAGLEQTGAAGRPLVRGIERVCGRFRRPQSRRRVAVRAEVPWAAKVPKRLEPSWRDWRRRRIRAACGGAEMNASLTAFRVGGRGSVGRRAVGAAAALRRPGGHINVAQRHRFSSFRPTENQEKCAIFAYTQPPLLCAPHRPSINTSLRSFAQPRRSRAFLL